MEVIGKSISQKIEVDRLTKMADNKEFVPLFDNDEPKNDIDLDDDDSDIFASAIQVNIKYHSAQFFDTPFS